MLEVKRNYFVLATNIVVFDCAKSIALQCLTSSIIFFMLQQITTCLLSGQWTHMTTNSTLRSCHSVTCNNIPNVNMADITLIENVVNGVHGIGVTVSII